MEMSRTRGTNLTAGFTLIELMITMAIVAILAAVAYPSYTEYTIRSERANARAALTNAVQWMERQYTANNTYPNSVGTGFDTSKYSIGISASNATSFTLQASPVSPWTDPKCGTLTVTNLTAKSASGTEGGTYCWSK